MDEQKIQPKRLRVGIISNGAINVDTLRAMLDMTPPGETLHICTSGRRFDVVEVGSASPEEEQIVREALANGTPMEQEALKVVTEATTEEEVNDFLRQYNMPFRELAYNTRKLTWGPGMLAAGKTYNEACLGELHSPEEIAKKAAEAAERAARAAKAEQKLSQGSRKEQAALLAVKGNSVNDILALMEFYNMRFQELVDLTIDVEWGTAMFLLSIEMLTSGAYQVSEPAAQA